MRLLSPNGTAVPNVNVGILAEIVVGRRVAHLDCAGLDRVGGLQPRHDLVGGEDLDLEPVVGRLGDRLRKRLGGAVERVERLREARGQAPFELRHRLRDGGLRNRGRGGGQAGRLQELTTLHGFLPGMMRFHCNADARSPRALRQGRATLADGRRQIQPAAIQLKVNCCRAGQERRTGPRPAGSGPRDRSRQDRVRVRIMKVS